MVRMAVLEIVLVSSVSERVVAAHAAFVVDLLVIDKIEGRVDIVAVTCGQDVTDAKLGQEYCVVEAEVEIDEVEIV